MSPVVSRCLACLQTELQNPVTSHRMNGIDFKPTPLNADTVAFCPYSGWEDLLACGCYELVADADPPQRIGHLTLLSATAEGRLAEVAWRPQHGPMTDTGILDCAWLPTATAAATGRRLLAVATAACDARLYHVQWGSESSSDESESSSVSESKTGTLVEACAPMPCADAGDACMGLDWSLDVTQPRLALSGTSGRAYVGELTGTGLRQLVAWQAHDLEGWAAAFDSNDANTLYTGADDAILKRWDLRQCLSHSDGEGGGSDEDAADPVMTASNRRSHGAGVQ